MTKINQLETKAKKELNEAREKTAFREIQESLQKIQAVEKELARLNESHKKLLEKDISEFEPTWADDDENLIPNMSTPNGYTRASRPVEFSSSPVTDLIKTSLERELERQRRRRRRRKRGLFQE